MLTLFFPPSFLFRLWSAYMDNTVRFSSLFKANFCNKVFSAWDYKITNARAVKLKKVFIKTDLQVCRHVCSMVRI